MYRPIRVNVLVVDDQRELRELVAKALTRDGHVVREASGLEQARTAISEDIDLIVLDLGLPDGSGLELCEQLRREMMDTPILILTAHNSVQERVTGLDAGADDFLGKPFAIAELRSRVRALGRRRAKGAAAMATVTAPGGVALDFGRRLASKSGAPVAVTPREWCILEALASRAGRVMTREELLHTGWGSDEPGPVSSLEVLIARLRKKLGDEVIRTVRGSGYVLAQR